MKQDKLQIAHWRKQERGWIASARLIMGLLGAAMLLVVYCLTIFAWLYGA